jgi:glycerol dehydrogenase-like iron-containing ADH family enzyme
MAGFELTLYGRIWVTPEARKGQKQSRKVVVRWKTIPHCGIFSGWPVIRPGLKNTRKKKQPHRVIHETDCAATSPIACMSLRALLV